MNKAILISNLKGIFESITPDEMLDNEIFRDSMEVFCDVLEVQCQPSIDISEQFNDGLFKEEFFKTYNAILFDTLNKLKTNNGFFDQNDTYREISGDLDLLNLDVLNSPHNFLPEEMLLTFRKFFEIKGVHEGIEFIYDWIGSHTPENIDFLDIQEKGPFQLEIEGNLSRQVYDYFVRVLQHPVGFQYTYTKLERIDLDRQNEQEYYQNQNNQYRITPDVIDGLGYTDFFQNNQNPYLKEFTKEDFKGFTEFHEPFKYDFKKLEFFTQNFQTLETRTLDFLFELDENLEYVYVDSQRVPAEVIDYIVNDQLSFMERTWVFQNGKSLSFKEVYQYGGKTLTYKDSSGDIFTLGQGETVEVSESGVEFEIIDSKTSILDYLYTLEQGWLDDESIERYPGTPSIWDGTVDTDWGQDVPSEWNWDQIQSNPRDNHNIAFDRVLSIEFQTLDEKQKPLRFDFKPSDVLVQAQTPYNNNLNDPRTLQESTYRDFEDWNSQYFDWNKPLRIPENNSEVFQQHNSKEHFYSQMSLDPWQLFDEEDGKEGFGYWHREDKRWKFIGQEPDSAGETQVRVGDQSLFVHRGVRKVPEIKGFVKIPPLQNDPNYAKSSHNLEITRDYWQPQGDVTYLYVGSVPDQIGQQNSDGTYKTLVGFNSGSAQNSDRIQYEEFLDWKHAELDNLTDFDSGVYWFEMPRPRATSDGLDKHTFYRGLSPRQEEMNYMHFDVIKDSLDPVNLQFRTLESLDVKLIKYSGEEIIETVSTFEASS